ncbi:MAG TPA: hypothetical protein VGI82_04355 [Chitinophagaceae bacterium]
MRESNEEWTTYFILPAHKTVKFKALQKKDNFDLLLKQGDAVPITLDYDVTETIESEQWIIPKQHFQNIKFYSMKNGSIAVDREAVTKATPYLICPSINDFKLISNYLLMYRLNDGTFSIECIINYDQYKIKHFLETEPLKLIKEKSNSVYALFMTSDARCVYVLYYDRNRDESSSLRDYIKRNPELRDERIIYANLTIYDSIDIMKKLGIFDRDYFEIDEENFDSYSTKLFISGKAFVKVSVLNQKDASHLLKESSGNTSRKFKKSFVNSVILSNGNVVAQYSPYVFLQFENHNDFESYLTHLENEFGPNDYEDDPQFISIETAIEKALSGNEKDGGFFKLPAPEADLETSLKALDKQVNAVFFDNFLIRKHLPELAIKVGNMIIKANGGSWKLDAVAHRQVIETGSGVRIDFIHHLYKELLRKRYTNYFSSSAIISGLFLGSKLKLASPDFLKE